ncbi:MAG: hypothetical protein ABSF43_16385 [Rectinemataceae bacterium]
MDYDRLPWCTYTNRAMMYFPDAEYSPISELNGRSRERLHFISAKATSGIRFAFITHNTGDLSIEHGNQKFPHPDFANLSLRIKSLYFINLFEALRRVEPSLVTNSMLEGSWTQKYRGLTEILEAEDLLFNQVWYNRHWSLRTGIEDGKIKIVERETFPRPSGEPGTIQRDIWEGALKAARNVEHCYGKKNLGP